MLIQNIFPSNDESALFTVLQIYLIYLVFPYSVVCETWTWLYIISQDLSLIALELFLKVEWQSPIHQ